MEALLDHFITQSVVYSLIAILLVTFLESLALVGLILPGTVMMAGLGALIGSGDVNFWQAWMAGSRWLSAGGRGFHSGLAGALSSRCTAGRSSKRTRRCWIRLNTRCISTVC
jgi:Uncharacterized membrane-associated protein